MSLYSRIRTRNSGPDTGDCTFTLNKPGWGGSRNISSSVYNPTTAYSNESISDSPFPNYRRRIAAGEVLVGSVLHVEESFETEPGGYAWRTLGNDWVYSFEGDCPEHAKAMALGYGTAPFLTVPTLESDNLVAGAKLMALGNLDRTPYEFAEDFGEWKETAQFLTAPLKSILGTTKHFRRTRRQVRMQTRNQKWKSEAQHHAFATAEAWNEYRFALSPLLRSVSDAIASVSDKIHRPKRRTARGRSQDENLVVSSEPHSGSNWDRTSSKSITATAGLIYEVSNPIVDWQFKYGLRFKDIPATIWAVMPLSFMVDRMFNISNSLRGLTSFLDPSVKILGGWSSLKTIEEQRRTWQNVQAIPNIRAPFHTDPSTTTLKRETYQRDAWSPTLSDFVPPLEVKKLAKDLTELADVAAIITTRLK